MKVREVLFLCFAATVGLAEQSTQTTPQTPDQEPATVVETHQEPGQGQDPKSLRPLLEGVQDVATMTPGRSLEVEYHVKCVEDVLYGDPEGLKRRINKLDERNAADPWVMAERSRLTELKDLVTTHGRLEKTDSPETEYLAALALSKWAEFEAALLPRDLKDPLLRTQAQARYDSAKEKREKFEGGRPNKLNLEERQEYERKREALLSAEGGAFQALMLLDLRFASAGRIGSVPLTDEIVSAERAISSKFDNLPLKDSALLLSTYDGQSEAHALRRNELYAPLTKAYERYVEATHAAFNGSGRFKSIPFTKAERKRTATALDRRLLAKSLHARLKTKAEGLYANLSEAVRGRLAHFLPLLAKCDSQGEKL